MKTYAEAHTEREPGTPAATRFTEPASSPAALADHHSPAMAQAKLADAIQHSAPMAAQRKRLAPLFGSAAQLATGPEEEELQKQADRAAVQRMTPEEELQKKAEPGAFQRKALEDEELTQGKFAPGARPVQFEEGAASRSNRTGLPDTLKAGIETLSGLSLDNVRVHYNSPKPAQLQALAYTQGTEIHVAPGQEQQLPHEAWHVVQQAQGRVQPTMQMEDGVPVNDDLGLEHEADVMGSRAAQMQPATYTASHAASFSTLAITQRYAEHETDDATAINTVWGARGTAGMQARSYMTHNFALDYNNTDNWARSQSNRHAEPMIVATFLANRGSSKKLNVVTERQPCGDCESDMKAIEKSASPKLTIEAYYFIEYAKSEGKDPLVAFYEGKGKLK